MEVKIIITLTDRKVFVAEGSIIPVTSNQAGIAGNALQKYSLKPMADAAIGAENPTVKETQPLRKPNKG
jgi:hypothetical protein